MTKLDKIRDLHKFFIKKFRPRKKITLRFSKKMRYHGSYSYYNNKHTITLNSRDNLITLYDNWSHEIGHALQKNKYGMKDHTDDWGICFAKAYNIYLEWDKLQK